jgi:uncharacterized membrane protein YqjE
VTTPSRAVPVSSTSSDPSSRKSKDQGSKSSGSRFSGARFPGSKSQNSSSHDSSFTGETPSLGNLVKDLPDRVTRLVKSELQLAKLELTTKLKAAGIGAGLLAAAAFFALVFFAVLVSAAVMGLAEVLPGWAAALIVAAVFLIIAAVLALLGINKLKKGVPPVPEESIESVKTDVSVVTGKDAR